MISNRIRADVRVGSIHKSDVADLIEIDSQAYSSFVSSEWFKRNYSRRNTVRFVVARENGVAVGYAGVVITRSNVVIVRFAVRQDKRREGIGTAIIDRIKGKLGKRLGSIIVAVGERNGISQLFLRSCEFKARRPGRVGIEAGAEADFYLFEYFYCGETLCQE